MSASKRRFWRLWRCEGRGNRCGFEYRDPLGCLEAFHRCPARSGDWVDLRGVAA